MRVGGDREERLVGTGAAVMVLIRVRVVSVLAATATAKWAAAVAPVIGVWSAVGVVGIVRWRARVSECEFVPSVEVARHAAFMGYR